MAQLKRKDPSTATAIPWQSLRVISLLAFYLYLGWSVIARAEEPQDLQRTGEKIYQYLKERYSIRQYDLDPQPLKRHIIFTLEDGRVLIYNDQGRLLSQQLSNGQQIQYDQGWPIQILSREGEVVSQTRYVRNARGQPDYSVTQQGAFCIRRFYNGQGQIDLEIEEQPDEGLVFRQGYVWDPGKYLYSYYATTAATGLTELYRVDAASGIIREHWRVTGGVMRDWRYPYLLFMRHLFRELHTEIADQRKQRRDSFNQTRASLIFSHLIPEQLYPVKRFAQDLRRGKIKFADDWQYIDVTDILLYLPLAELVPLPKVVVKNVRLKGNSILVYSQERKRWEPYPFNPAEEILVPVGLMEDYQIESKFERNQWRLVPDQMEKLVFSRRFLVATKELERIQQQLSQPLYFTEEKDDFFELLHATAKAEPSQLASSLPSAKLNLGKITPEFHRQLIFQLNCQIKADLRTRPEWQQRDSYSRTQAESLFPLITPEQLLPWALFLSQTNKFTRQPAGPFEKISYSDLVVRLPEMQKKKLYQYLQPVRYHQGALSVWEADTELPEKGYWKPYTLRPKRDKLVQRGGKFMIQVDQDQFQWAPLATWIMERLTGQIYLLLPPGQDDFSLPESLAQKSLAPPLPAKVSALKSRRTQPEMFAYCLQFLDKQKKSLATILRLHPGVIKAGRLLLRLAAKLKKGRAGEEILLYKSRPHWYETFIAQRGWWGQRQTYRRTLKMPLGQASQREMYTADKHLVFLQDQAEMAYQIIYQSNGQVKIKRGQGSQTQILEYRHGRLQAVTLSDGSQCLYTYKTGQTRVQYKTKAGQMVLEKIYDEQDRLKEMRFEPMEKVSYRYLEGPIEMVLSNAIGDQAILTLNPQGKIIKQRGHEKLIRIAKINISFLFPDVLNNREIRFNLNFP